MDMKIRGLSLAAARAWACLCMVLALTGCQVGLHEEVTSKKPYADLIGAKYSVVADGLYAYGVYESRNNKTIRFVDLIPLPIGGSELAFKQTVPKGRVIKILSAWRHHKVLETLVYYVVAIEDSDLPESAPVWLELSRGNEGVGVDLNPAIYKRLPKGN
jgi:hypothetical protein